MRKFLAFVLGLFIAVPMLFFAFLLISVRPWVIDRNFYKQALADERLYSGIKDMPKLESGKTVELEGLSLNEAALQSGISAAIPTAEIKKLSGNSVDAVFDFLEGKAGAPDSIDLEPLKSSLRANTKKFVSAYVEALPEGGSAQSDPADLSVLPKGATRAAYAAKINPAVSKALDAGMAKVDSRIKLRHVRPQARGWAFTGNLQADYVRLMVGTLAGAALMWLLAGMLWPKPWSSRLPFMGGLLILSSAVIIIAGVCGAFAVNFQSVEKGMQALGVPSGWAGSGAQAAAVKNYFAGLAATMTRGFFITGIIAASVGAGLISMRWVAAAREI